MEDSLTNLFGTVIAGNPITQLAKNMSKASNFGEMSSSSSPIAAVLVEIPEPCPMSEIIHYIVIAIALYLAMKCKSGSGGIDPLQLILAFCCAPCYIAYRLVKPCGA